jgi:hypothetical protein
MQQRHMRSMRSPFPPGSHDPRERFYSQRASMRIEALGGSRGRFAYFVMSTLNEDEPLVATPVMCVLPGAR